MIAALPMTQDRRTYATEHLGAAMLTLVLLGGAARSRRKRRRRGPIELGPRLDPGKFNLNRCRSMA